MMKDILLRAQRLNLPLPSAIKNFFRSRLETLVQKDDDERQVEDWSMPLILGGAPVAATAPTVVESPAVQAAENPSRAPLLRSTADAFPGTGLKCLFVSSSLDVGGMEEVVVFLAQRLRQRGIHVAVLHACDTAGEDGIPTGRLGQFLLSQGIVTVRFGGDAAVRWMKQWNPDVISAHGAPSWILAAAASLNIPCVATLHGMHTIFGADPRVVAQTGRYLEAIVAVSDLMRAQYLHVNPDYPQARIVTIPNGVDDARRKRLNRAAARARHGVRSEYVFVSLGRHCLQKNPYGLVKAFRHVAEKYPDVHLVIAGRPDDKSYLTQVIELRDSLRCRERIHIRDHHSEPSELLALADGFVLDSFFEGWSLASMEALHVGLPVVLSEVGGAKEQVGTGLDCGYIVPNPVGDPLQVNWESMRAVRFGGQANANALVAAMCSVRERREWWYAQRQRIAAESADRFSPDLCVRRHAEVLVAAATGAGSFASNYKQAVQA
jgi:glycosyltransferase involved in cell wall biosynthesis